VRSLLQAAGDEIDVDFENVRRAGIRALSLRHLVEQSCTDTMLRFGRALGPRPLAFDGWIARRFQELSLYIRQSHAEADLEHLGRKSLQQIAFCVRGDQSEHVNKTADVPT
jgi:hypothetical protein